MKEKYVITVGHGISAVAPSHQVLYFGVVDTDLLPYVGIASQLLLA
jgi:hypothetical protein